MTTNADILDSRCCCVRQALPPPEVYLIENITGLGVMSTIHLITYLFRFDVACILSLLGVYYCIYQVLLAYSSINKRYLECYYNNDDLDEDEDENEDENEEFAECHEVADDNEGEEADEADEADDSEDTIIAKEQVNKPEICPRAEGGCGNRDSTWCCPCDTTDYSDMPPLVGIPDDKVLRQLQEIVDETNARNIQRAEFQSMYESNDNAIEQIKDTLNQLQTMITNVKAMRKENETIKEFKSLN